MAPSGSCYVACLTQNEAIALADTNLRESRQRVDVVRVDLDQIIHKEEQQRRSVRHRTVFLARDSNADLTSNASEQGYTSQSGFVTNNAT